ncbi:MAG: helix-turn-helix domain-containing protein [Rhodospirillales bacterium]|nr:helix-turn-helix domain-containing protein [Rhodospirillales bacterium]
MPESRETVAAFRNGIAMLRSFSGAHRRQTISEAATRTGLSRAAARRLLLTLCDTGLARSDGKHFELTAAVLEIGQNFLAGMTEIEIVRLVLQTYVRRTGEAASAAMLVGQDVIYLDRVPAPVRPPGVPVGAGMRRAAHATAVGHVLLSGLPAPELRRFLAAAPLDPYTPHTLTTGEALRARLAMVRGQGFAVSNQEFLLGLRSIAVPVPGMTGGTRIGIASGVPAARVQETEMRARLLAPLREAAETIGAAMARA